MLEETYKTAENTSDRVVSAVGSLTKPLSIIASMAAVGTPYAYYLGTKYFDSYYNTIGADWFSRSVTTADRLLVVAAPFAIFLLFVGTALEAYAKGALNAESSRKHIIYSLALSIFFYTLHAGTAILLDGYESYWWLAGAFFAFLSLCGAVSVSIILLSEKRSTPLSEFIYIFIMIGVTACSHVATEAGRVTAESDLENKFSDKPIAIMQQKSDCPWRVIQSLDSSRVAIVKPLRKPIYRMVNSGEIIGSNKAEKDNCRK